uniref:Uncharacterized protein n=1 Tax=Sus scrofa TaxID=9823 RepID=A0A480IC43_PIG
MGLGLHLQRQLLLVQLPARGLAPLFFPDAPTCRLPAHQILDSPNLPRWMLVGTCGSCLLDLLPAESKTQTESIAFVFLVSGASCREGIKMSQVRVHHFFQLTANMNHCST